MTGFLALLCVGAATLMTFGFAGACVAPRGTWYRECSLASMVIGVLSGWLGILGWLWWLGLRAAGVIGG